MYSNSELDMIKKNSSCSATASKPLAHGANAQMDRFVKCPAINWLLHLRFLQRIISALGMWVLLGSFFMFFNLYQLDVQNETCVALANL